MVLWRECVVLSVISLGNSKNLKYYTFSMIIPFLLLFTTSAILMMEKYLKNIKNQLGY